MSEPTPIELLERRLEPPLRMACDVVVDCSQQHGIRVWIVGGPVRDLFTTRALKDLDFVVDGDGIAFAREVADRIAGKLVIHERFGTAVIEVAPSVRLDIASTRQESYPSPGALPEVMTGDIEADLRRRDFTINAMALPVGFDRSGMLLDPVGGRADIEAGLIRVLHDRSFLDDPTRILRAERFAARFGFEIEEDTAGLMRAARDDGALRTVSPGRLGTELVLLLQEESPATGLERFGRQGLLAGLLGDSWRPRADCHDFGMRLLDTTDWLQQTGVQPVDLRPWIVWWIHLAVQLDAGEAARAATDLQLGARMQQATADLSRLETARAVLTGHDCRESLLYEALHGLMPETLLYLAATGEGREVRRRLARYLTVLQSTQPWVTGRDLEELGMPRTAARGDLLKRLFHDQLDRKLVSRDGAIEEAKRIVTEE